MIYEICIMPITPLIMVFSTGIDYQNLPLANRRAIGDASIIGGQNNRMISDEFLYGLIANESLSFETAHYIWQSSIQTAYDLGKAAGGKTTQPSVISINLGLKL